MAIEQELRNSSRKLSNYRWNGLTASLVSFFNTVLVPFSANQTVEVTNRAQLLRQFRRGPLPLQLRPASGDGTAGAGISNAVRETARYR